MPEPSLPAEPIARPAARVLLVNAEDRVLLFRGGDPARPQDPPYWFTVGGGLDPGETPVEGAVRETREETGLVRTAADLVGPVWHEVVEFPFDGVTYRQSQDFFVSRVEHWDVDTSAFNEVEVRSIDRYRWWSAEEIEAADEVCYPLGLADLLRRVVREVA
jgi:8-oxo-dGTP pyrophosphatase MutT (NUDIX family)